MGDSGVYLITTILGISTITAYKSELSSIKTVEEIFLLFCIPGIDMFRLFLTRILNKKNPFKADKNHFHHLLKNKISSSWSIVIYFLVIIIGLLLKYININVTICILILLIIYFYLLWYLKKK
jgi:UDP-GlcNAc:undecaprenyl-phosphate GlcNAc-1-phosphate transferase